MSKKKQTYDLDQIISSTGYEIWCIADTDIKHRENGPAEIYADKKVKRWYYEGKLHRDDGPAIEYQGDTRYFIHGVHIPELDNKKIYGKKKLAKYLLLI